MDIALLAYYFPPSRAVGSIRAMNVAKAFAAAGHHVTVITAASGDGPPRPARSDAGIDILPVIPLRNLRELYARWKARHPGGAEPSSMGATSEPPSHKEVAGWRRLIFSLIWLPDDRQGFIPPAVRALRKLRPRPDAVISTGPPFSTHLASLAGRFMIRRPWIMELRDPWSGNAQKPSWVRTRLTDALDRILEGLCLRTAALVVGASEGIERQIRERLPQSPAQQKLLLVRNGISNLAPRPEAHRDSGGSPFDLVHMGTIYYSRDPGPVLRAIQRLADSGTIRPGSFRFRLIGDSGGDRVENQVRQLGIGDYIETPGWVSYTEAQEIMRRANALLLLAQGQPDQVPNKLYDYLGTRKPILALADADGETARMLDQVGGHYVTHSASETQQALEKLIVAPQTQESSPSAEQLLQEWTTGSQMARYVQAVTEVVNGVG